LLEGLGVGAGAASGVSLGRATVRTWLRWMGLGLLVAAVSVSSAWAIGAGDAHLEETDAVHGGAFHRDDPPALAPVTLGGRSLPEPASRTSPLRPAGAHAAPSPAAASTEDELARLREARLAIVHGNAGPALSALAAHAREFPHGAFQEEAAALRVEALVAAGRFDDARRAADAFDAAYPRSPYGPRVRQSVR